MKHCSVLLRSRVARMMMTPHSCVATSSKTVVEETTEVNQNNLKKKKKPVDDEWKVSMLRMLETEYKSQQGKFRSQVARKAAQTLIMRYTVNDDMHSLIRLAEGQTRSAGDGQLLALCFLVISRKFDSILRKVEDVNSNDALSLFLSVGSVWSNIRRGSNDATAMCLLTMSALRRWHDERKFDSKSPQIADLFETMTRKLGDLAGDFRIDECKSYISPDDRGRIEKEFAKVVRFHLPIRKREETSRYDINLDLVAPLQVSCGENEYRHNPFQLENVGKEKYVEKFASQIQLEAAAWLHVPNTVADSKNVTKHAEELISEWNWDKRIKENLASLDTKHIQPVVASCLASIDRDRLVDLLLSCALAACSQGQNLVVVSTFQHDLVMPVLRELNALFKKKLGYDEMKVWKEVFDNYAAYFDDAEISRKYTHREWWGKVCAKAKVPAHFQFEVGQLEAATRQEMANVFSNVLLNSCLFPSPVRNSSQTTWTPAFSFRSVSIEEESRVTSSSRLSLSRMLSIHSHLTSLFEDHPFKYILFSTQQLPMTLPPRPWIDYGIGGPLYTQKVDVIRNMYEFKSVNLNEETRKRITAPQQARPVFDALNQLGSTPWVINEKMLTVLKEVFGKSGNVNSRPLLDKLDIPMREDTIKVPQFEEEFGMGTRKEDIEVEKWRDYARRKAEAVKIRNESNSLWCWMQYRVVLADHFRGQTLFFPHNMDFRGRVYPLSPYLSHMGDDVNRCILKFAKGQKLGPKGFEWLKIHCINLTGTLKRASVADRLAEADRLIPAIRESARDPLGDGKWWMDSDEPWQTLAACIEIDDALNHSGDISSFSSRLPVHQDGSCNGLQHYAALGRDKEGGKQVNLTKSDLPNDVYSDVAQRVEQKRKEDEMSGEDQEVAQKLRSALPQDVPRKVIKQTVMTTVYGVTMYGAVQQIKRQLRAIGIENDDAAIFARYLARKTFASLNDAFTSSMALKDWFRRCAKGTSDLMRTVEWVTPLGLPVVQPYCKAAEKKGRIVLTPISTKQVDAFPPNFVHSLDSTHMMLTSLNCSQRGLTFAAVHDCFWTHSASVDEMNAICRQQFVSLHSQPIVQQCANWFEKTYLTEKVGKILPEEQLKKYRDIFANKVKPGELDIEQVKQSVYFFS